MRRIITFDPIFMRGWGDLYLLPHIDISIFYSRPTITFAWGIFRLDMKIHKTLPDWLMKVWDILTLNFRNKDEEDE